VGDASRSDSIDLLHTGIALDLTNTTNGIIAGTATITFAPLVPGITILPLDLVLPADSVVMNGVQLPFTQPGEELLIDLQGSYGPGDTLTLAVTYHGDPLTDPSGFGGFYTLGNYQYDLGVAFDAVPHSYGRAWFPCFDNFVERCTFDYDVHTNGGRSVYANGLLTDITDLGGGERISHWHLAEAVPAYLASVAAGNYTAVLDTFPSVSGTDIPVVLAALPEDTTAMKNSFIHLQNAFDTYEQWFGPYRWERVGYVLTSAGAMEHATNICYPDFAADGTLTDENLYAHELSHHWFGDLITCARPEEMYINEGFADFCSYLFLGGLYGTDAYRTAVRNNHHKVVSSAHLSDDGWYALNDVPEAHTYGVTSYSKGADVARTLRSVLGDSLFSAGLKQVFAEDAYSSVSSEKLRDDLGTATGTDLTDFFNDWIFQPGGAAFSVDSFSVAPSGGQFVVDVHGHQKTRGGASLFAHVPVSLTCIGADGALQRTTEDLNGEFQNITVSCPFAPVKVHLNDDERLALASTVDERTISVTGQTNLALADLWVTTTALPQPMPLRVEEYWVAADPQTGEANAFVVSPDRWWRVEGSFPQGTAMTARFTVDGRPTSGTAFDQGLTVAAGAVAFNEDSLVVLYRPDAHSPWMVRPNCVVHSLGSHTDGFAQIDMPGFIAGDYTIGWHMSAAGIGETVLPRNGWLYFPDPTSGSVTVQAPPGTRMNGTTLLLSDMQGRSIGRFALTAASSQVDVSQVRAQQVVLSVRSASGDTIPLGPLHIIH
jgi:aminopeptidase N